MLYFKNFINSTKRAFSSTPEDYLVHLTLETTALKDSVKDVTEQDLEPLVHNILALKLFRSA